MLLPLSGMPNPQTIFIGHTTYHHTCDTWCMQCVSSVAVVLSTHTKRLTLRLYVLLSVLLPSTLWRKHVLWWGVCLQLASVQSLSPCTATLRELYRKGTYTYTSLNSVWRPQKRNSRLCTHTYTHTHARTLTHAPTLTHTHARTLTHLHSHTHHWNMCAGHSPLFLPPCMEQRVTIPWRHSWRFVYEYITTQIYNSGCKICK